MNESITVRTMVKDDLDALEIIENESFLEKDPDFGVMAVSPEAWTRKEIRRCAFKEQNTAGYTIEEGQGNIIGYYIFDNTNEGLLIRRLLIHPQYRNAAVGSTALFKICEQSVRSKAKRTIIGYVSERDIATCKWMAYKGFKSKLVRQGWDENTDAIKFTYVCVNKQRPQRKCSA